MAEIIPFIRAAAPASVAVDARNGLEDSSSGHASRPSGRFVPAGPGRARVLRFPFPAAAPLPAPAPAYLPAAPEAGATITDQKKAMKAKIHIALRGRRGVPGLLATLPGFNGEVYRFALEERWGVSSCANMSVTQLDEVLAWLAELGFQSNRPFYARRDYNRWGQSALIGKVNALLAEKGRKENGKFLGMEYAEGILKRQTRSEVDNIYKASPKQLRAVIAALDKDASRKGRRRR